MSSERRPFLGLSWFQLIAGALAAMTSAWIASALGVAGTIIGAAVGSFVAAISSAFYANSLDRTRTLIVRTDSGTVVEAPADPGETAEALQAVRDATGSEIQGAQVIETSSRCSFGVGAIVTSFVVALLFAGAAMGTYELLTDKSYGVKTDNAKIGNPFGGGSSTASDDSDDSPEPTVTTSTAPTPTETVSTEPTPTNSTPTPTETTATPTPEPTE